MILSLNLGPPRECTHVHVHVHTLTHTHHTLVPKHMYEYIYMNAHIEMENKEEMSSFGLADHEWVGAVTTPFPEILNKRLSGTRTISQTSFSLLLDQME